jgi:regulator of cell morphogenesis and NO signaling
MPHEVQDTGALIENILTCHHAVYRQEAPGQGDMAMAMELMRDEHGDHAATLNQLAELTRGHRPPEDACGTWRALYTGTAKFADDLREHVRLENDMLFPGCGG